MSNNPTISQIKASITEGHAFEKHKDDYKALGVEVNGRDDFSNLVNKAFDDPDIEIASVTKPNGNTSILIKSPETQSVILINPSPKKNGDLGSMFPIRAEVNHIDPETGKKVRYSRLDANGRPDLENLDEKFSRMVDKEMGNIADSHLVRGTAADLNNHLQSFARTIDLDEAKFKKIKSNLDTPEVHNRIIDNVLESDKLKSIAADPNGMVIHVIDENTNSIVTVDNRTGQRTIQQFDNIEDAKFSFGGLMNEAKGELEEMPRLIEGGVDAVNDVLRYNNSLWGKVADVAGDTAQFLGRAAKVLGPLGVIGAGAEAAQLEADMQTAVEYGLLNENAVLEYRGILATHLAQGTVDPSMVGGEAVVQQLYEEWCNKHGVDSELKEQLEPGSLLEDVFGEEIDLTSNDSELSLQSLNPSLQQTNGTVQKINTDTIRPSQQEFINIAP